MTPARLALIITNASCCPMNDADARRFIELLEDAGYSITKKRKLGKFEFAIRIDGIITAERQFTTPAGAWSHVRDLIDAQLATLEEMRMMGYTVTRVKKVGY